MALFIALMALNPDIQKRAQRELDQYLDHRLPEFEDEDYLPYTFAVMLEVLRYLSSSFCYVVTTFSMAMKVGTDHSPR